MLCSIRSPELFHIQTGSAYSTGANQLWFRTRWQRDSGCGPTTCSQILWYLSRTRRWAEPLCAHDASGQPGFLQLMEQVWQYVTPTVMGLNSTDLFARGVTRYGESRHVRLDCRCLNVSAIPALRPDAADVRRFLLDALEADTPVAFLNLSNGSLRNLGSWHWVTLTGLDPDSLAAQILDNGSTPTIDLAAWLSTTTLGGGFCRIVEAV